MDIFDTTNLTQAQSVLDTLTVEDGKVYKGKRCIATIYLYADRVIIMSKNQKEMIEFLDEDVIRRVHIISRALDMSIYRRGDKYVLIYPKKEGDYIMPLYEEVYTSYEVAYKKFKEYMNNEF